MARYCLSSGEEVLDQMPGIIKRFIISARVLTVAARRDDEALTGLFERQDHAFVGVIGFIGNHDIGLHFGKQDIGAIQIAGLSRRQQEAGRIAQSIDRGMDFGAQPATAAAYSLVLTPFLRAPALCWWARTMVLSIIAYSLSASPARCLKTFAYTPLLAQRLKRVCTLRNSPNRSGKSRHGIPAR